MKEQIIIIDDLYDIPHQYHKGFFENQCVITDETKGKIAQILGHNIEITSATNETNSCTDVVAHLRCDWIAVICLSLPFDAFGEFGLTFYSHLSTGLETFPTQKEIEELQIDQNELRTIFDSDLKLWKEYAKIPLKWNRMILFRGDRWHSYGSTINTSMLYQKLIIKHG